jgi:hypothetical protein
VPILLLWQNKCEFYRNHDLATIVVVCRWRSLPEVIEIMEQISTALALALDLPTRDDFEQSYEN